VKDFSTISGWDPDRKPKYLTVCNDLIYFSAADDANGDELWQSDGTPAGTVMVMDINSGGSSSPRGLTAVGNSLYFTADDGSGAEKHGREIWKVDPATGIPVMIKDIFSG